MTMTTVTMMKSVAIALGGDYDNDDNDGNRDDDDSDNDEMCCHSMLAGGGDNANKRDTLNKSSTLGSIRKLEP